MLARLHDLEGALKRNKVDCYNVTLSAAGYRFTSWERESTLRPKLEMLGCTDLDFIDDFEYGSPVTYVTFLPPSDL